MNRLQRMKLQMINMRRIVTNPLAPHNKTMRPLSKGSRGGGLGHCDKCDKPRMVFVTCHPDLVTLCDRHS